MLVRLLDDDRLLRVLLVGRDDLSLGFTLERQIVLLLRARRARFRPERGVATPDRLIGVVIRHFETTHERLLEITLAGVTVYVVLTALVFELKWRRRRYSSSNRMEQSLHMRFCHELVKTTEK